MGDYNFDGSMDIAGIVFNLLVEAIFEIESLDTECGVVEGSILISIEVDGVVSLCK